MMIQIEVECYAGHKADETPRRFLSEERRIDGEEVVDCRYQVESMAEWSRADTSKSREPTGTTI